MHYLSQESLEALLEDLSGDWNVFVPVRHDGKRCYRRWPVNGAPVVIGEVRTYDPIKGFFFRAREQVAEGFDATPPPGSGKPLCLVGVKACDLKGFAIEDFVFSPPDAPDPFYGRVRDLALVIASDCTSVLDTCFCLAWGLQPHPVDHFDLNLGSVDGGYIVEVGSDAGQMIVDSLPDLFQDVPEESLAQRDAQREAVAGAVRASIRAHDIPAESELRMAYERNYESPLWEAEARHCVECGACNTICPTCHCFLLCDQMHEDRFVRFRLWDSCMVKDFAKVAGEGNPRPRLWMRLRNRFEKKFDYFPKVANQYACTGCGRCITACPARIDIRRVLKRMAANV